MQPINERPELLIPTIKGGKTNPTCHASSPIDTVLSGSVDPRLVCCSCPDATHAAGGENGWDRGGLPTYLTSHHIGAPDHSSRLVCCLVPRWCCLLALVIQRAPLSLRLLETVGLRGHENTVISSPLLYAWPTIVCARFFCFALLRINARRMRRLAQ